MPVADHREDTTLTVNALVDQLIRSRKVTNEQYKHLYDLVLADGTIDEDERRQINRLFDAIQVGRVIIMD
ncbi:hypothetical protein [Leptolyngbya sp. PCC 6406]|uniref:hypothetical protein n=1 Tax=Leptolyngbya sp. PCC 6406 TaxID=1173264 RepID=UPI0002ABE3F0